MCAVAFKIRNCNRGGEEAAHRNSSANNQPYAKTESVRYSPACAHISYSHPYYTPLTFNVTYLEYYQNRKRYTLVLVPQRLSLPSVCTTSR